MLAHRRGHWPREILPISGKANQARRRKIDILVNNAVEQHPQESITKITEKQLEKTFRTNIFAMFFLTKAA
jgi:NAD(P)-dependent dehydrogenase (short-subunit alcohol dehydrogenase family)